MEALTAIRQTGASVTPVGSRVTCNPPPMDTDEDYLVWIHDQASEDALRAALNGDGGWEMGGSSIPDEANSVPVADRFYAYRNGAVNLIVTHSQTFAHRFLAATSLAKRFNLLDKADRIALFQGVLYGRIDAQNLQAPELDAEQAASPIADEVLF
jgi:hypothetical protein